MLDNTCIIYLWFWGVFFGFGCCALFVCLFVCCLFVCGGCAGSYFVGFVCVVGFFVQLL